MSGLGQTIYEEGFKEGFKEGFEEGFEEVVEKTLRLLISSGKISQSDAEEIRKAVKTESLPFANKD